MGRFSFLHIKQANFRGYHMVNLGGQQALVATPEKALLDLVSLQEKGEPSEFLLGLRLQNLDTLDLSILHQQAEDFSIPEMQLAVKEIERLTKIEQKEYVSL